MSRNKEIEYITQYYSNYDEDGRLTVKSRRAEFLTTMKYIEKYLTQGAKILEIGAGTGRYSLALAEKGYDVTAVELVKHNMDIMKSKIKPKHNITVLQGDALNLSFTDNEAYDIVLLLGPMYHLFNDSDKRKALSEAVRAAKKNGVIFVSYCNSDSSIYKIFADGNIHKYADKIDADFHAKSVPEFVFELYRKEDVDRLVSGFNVKRLHYLGSDMLTPFFRDKFDELSNEDFDLYMKYHYAICERADCVGFSFHLLDILRKE